MRTNRIIATVLCLLMSILSACSGDATVNSSSNTAKLSSTISTISIPSDRNISTSAKPSSAATAPSTSSAKQESSQPDEIASTSSEASSNSSLLTFSYKSELTFIPAHVDKILGKWKGTYDLAKSFAIDGLEPCYVDYTVEFTKDNKYIETLETTSYQKALQIILPKTIEAELQANGLTIEDWESQTGKSFTEYVNTSIQTAVADNRLESNYKFEWIYDLYIYDPTAKQYYETEYSFTGTDTLSLTQQGVTITYTRIP